MESSKICPMLLKYGEGSVNRANLPALVDNMGKPLCVCDAPSSDCPKSRHIFSEPGFLTRPETRMNLMTTAPFLHAFLDGFQEYFPPSYTF